MSGKAQQQSRIKELILLGREQGYLTYAEVNDHLPEDISDPEQVEDIIRMINDMGINVFEVAPDKDSLMLADADTDEAAAEEAAAALAAGPGVARPAGRGLPVGLTGPAPGVGGPGPGFGGGFPGAPGGFGGPPGFPGRGGPPGGPRTFPLSIS